MTILTTAQPVLETTRLTLRLPRKSDTGLVSLYTSDWRVARMTSSIPHPNPPGAVEAFFETITDPGARDMVWAIDASKGFGTEIVGLISLGSDGEIGYWIAPFFWGLGIACEALAAVLTFADENGRDRTWAGAFQENGASQRVLEKCGFGRVGEIEIFSVSRDALMPSYRYERSQGDGG